MSETNESGPAIRRHWRRFLEDRSGATAIEYGVIASLIVLTIIASIQLLATEVAANWMNVVTNVVAATQ